MRRIRLVAIAIPILLAVAACGGGNQPNPPSSQASTQTPAPAPTTVSGPADQKALAPLFGTWALDLASCGKQALTISAKRFEGPGSGCDITGLTDTLERDGLVERLLLPEDRRARKVRLTERGREVFAHMATTHESWINAWFSSLTPTEQQALYTLLGKLKHGMSA